MPTPGTRRPIDVPQPRPQPFSPLPEPVEVPEPEPEDDEDFYRADGDMICRTCVKEYWRHPYSTHRSGMGHPYLRRLCNGDLVKL